MNDDELLERVTALHDELRRPIYVWSMSGGRYARLREKGVPEYDYRVRGALTSLRKAAREIDLIVRNYALVVRSLESEEHA